VYAALVLDMCWENREFEVDPRLVPFLGRARFFFKGAASF